MEQDRGAPQLWIKALPDGEHQEGVRVDLGVRLLSLEYEDDEHKADKLKLTLDNYDLALFDDPAFRNGMMLQAAWGYPGNMAPARKCIVTSIKGGKVFNVEALSHSVALNTKERTATYEWKRHSDIVRFIAKYSGFTKTQQQIQDTSIVYPAVHQAKMTDAQFLRKLADAEGFEFYVDHDGLHWHPRKLGQAPSKVLRYFTEPNVGEVLDFSLNTDIHAKAGKTTIKGRDPLERKDYSAEASNSLDKIRDSLGSLLEVVDPEEGNTRLEQRVSREHVIPSPTSNPAKAQREAEGKFRKGQLSAVKLQLELVGDPTLLAKTVVQVEGLGKRLSGRYYVHKAVHVLDSGGYKTTVHLLSDGHGGHSTESKVAPGVELQPGTPSQGKKNTEPPAPGTDSKETAPLEPFEEVDEETGDTRIVYRVKR